MIAVNNPLWQTVAVFGLLGVAILISAKHRAKPAGLIPISVTQELKGLAILFVYFSHIGNFLVADHRFLSPLSGLSQPGVDLFLVLSGFGLSVSNLKRPQQPLAFYYRLIKLFIPFWIALSLLLIGDVTLLHVHRAGHTIVEAYFSIFLTSNLMQDINAPFWFITYITGCYLVFPLIFSKQRLWLSALIMLAIGISLTAFNPTVLNQVMFLYKLHYAAFPAGMLLAWLLYGRAKPSHKLAVPHWTLSQQLIIRYGTITALIAALFLINPAAAASHGAFVRQLADMAFALVLIALFILKQHDLRLLSLLGVYSFEFYLLHWPLISRYNFLYSHVPAWLATMIYLILIMCFGVVLQKLSTETEAAIRFRKLR